MTWRVEELNRRVEVEVSARPMRPGEMGDLADALRPYFEAPRFSQVVVRGLEDQASPPPVHILRSLEEWGREYETEFQLRPRLPAGRGHA